MTFKTPETRAAFFEAATEWKSAKIDEENRVSEYTRRLLDQAEQHPLKK